MNATQVKKSDPILPVSSSWGQLKYKAATKCHGKHPSSVGDLVPLVPSKN